MRITLRVTAGPHKGQKFTFDGHEMFIVGRSKRAHFQLADKDRYLGRVHFLVEINPPYCRLMDLASRNGTYVNERRVGMADLQDGDKIQAGRTILRVAVEDDDPSEARAADILAAEEPPAIDALPTLQPRPAPPRPEEPALSQPRPSPVPERCRVCGAVSVVDLGSRVDPAGVVLPPLCAACREQIRSQPQPIPRYLLVRELGRGGMGVVYLALRKSEGTVIALKTIKPKVVVTKKEVERFRREARILRELHHPHIVAFHEMGEAGDPLFFTMEFVPGTNAAHLLKTHGPLPVRRAVALICQVLDALAYAHAKGFVHRDIKPANLLVTEVDGREAIKLADFGLARVYQTSRLSGLTMMDDVIGTVPFMAPEQIDNFREAKPPVDQYAAAAALYNFLTGRFLFDFEGDKIKAIKIVLEEEPVPIQKRRKDIPKELAAIIHRALAKEPGERFADVKAMRQALARFCQ
ncbi:MAG: protein kinase [Gemmataceae bacterium]|nr:protein kinase [Gemmataceae bacterium]